MCLKWVRHKYDLEFLPNGNNASIEDVEKMYDEMEQVSIDYTNRFDFKTIENGVDSPIIAEIENNLKECASEPEKLIYLFSLITPFGNWAMLVHPKAQIERYRAAIAECKQRLREWQNERQFIDENTGKDVNPREQIGACENIIKECNEFIQRLEDNSKRFDEIINAAIPGNTVEWCCFKWFSYALKFANRLDALLLTYGIDLIELQKRCGVYLKNSRSISDVEYYIGSIDLAEYYISSLPTTGHNKRGGPHDRPEVSTLPDELATPEALKIFEQARELGLIDKDYRWLYSLQLLACFAREMSLKFNLGKGRNSDGTPRISWQPFERLFKLSNGKLRASYNDIQKTGQQPIGYTLIDRLFK